MTTATEGRAIVSDENPFFVTPRGFYRRWLAMLDDHAELQGHVDSLEASTEDKWVPVWRAAGRTHEDLGDALEAQKDYEGARREHLIAKTYYAIARFPWELSPLKRDASADCARAFRKANAHLDPPVQVVDIPCDGRSIRAHFRAPSASKPVGAVLIMCGADVFKEDRGWASDMCIAEGLAALVMDAPGTGENPFPWAPESVKAWMAAVDWMAARPEVDGNRIGAFGISRGGYSVMQLAGAYPEMIKAVVASAGHPFGYELTPEEMDWVVEGRSRRSLFVYGPPGSPPAFPKWSREKESEIFERWSLKSLGLVDRITMPTLLINGKNDILAPIGNIYYMLEHGPVTGREARIYPDGGHCAFKYYKEWAPASFKWLADKLSR
jgi:acetyl esterase/lipase